MALEDAQAAARRLEHTDSRARALAKVGAQMNGPARVPVLCDALSAAQAIEGDEPRLEVLAELVPHLSGPLLVEAVSVARGIEDPRLWASAIGAVVRTGADRDNLLRTLRRDVVERLWSQISLGERREAYEFCGRLFRAPLVPTRVVEGVAMCIGDIGLRWTWP
jgi:hypothetical protein